MAEPLKYAIGAHTVAELAERFAAADPDWDVGPLRATIAELDALELKERINLIADRIAGDQADDRPFLSTLAAVVSVCGDESLDMWAAWPLASVIERHGIGHPMESLAAMETVTRRFSCEFAIRPFLEHHTDRTFEWLSEWVDHEHEAVRRLVSEGTRPYLPWGPRVGVLTENPERAIALLDRLRLDPSETVRRSVANHLNDVAKFRPDLVTGTLRRWLDAAGPGPPGPDQQMVRHALRTLVKSGNPEAMELLGFTTDAAVEVHRFDCAPDVIKLGETVELTAEIRSTGSVAQRLVVDFVIHHVKANGDTSPKVFKWTTTTLEPGESISLAKSRPVRPISTRVYHPGRHQVDLQIAGHVVASCGFDLTLQP